VIGETGWATTSHDQGEQAKLIKGKPGEKEQSEFYKTVYQWAEKTKNIVFYFEAFDENWKGGPHPNEVEKHWGFYNADRSAKATFNKSQVN
ncbi:MAG: glycosyl hydrolase family 17, partial [bacterium]|nr:glycosyl hydrolase family 17 [bacterium]